MIAHCRTLKTISMATFVDALVRNVLYKCAEFLSLCTIFEGYRPILDAMKSLSTNSQCHSTDIEVPYSQTDTCVVVYFF